MMAKKMRTAARHSIACLTEPIRADLDDARQRGIGPGQKAES